MSFKTMRGMLYPDGKLALPSDEIPDHPVAVMVTLLEQDEETSLSKLGDYHEMLTDYEERLARGEIQWQ